MSVITLGRVRTTTTTATRPAPRSAPWAAAFVGFVAGFLLALVPAAFVTRVLATQLPLGGTVVHGRTAMTIALVLTTCVAVATAVCAAARAVHGKG